MTRRYEFTFRATDPDDDRYFVLHGVGNVRRTAERSARTQLRRLDVDPRHFYTDAVVFLPEGR
jgi:hypothetical protein